MQKKELKKDIMQKKTK